VTFVKNVAIILLYLYTLFYTSRFSQSQGIFVPNNFLKKHRDCAPRDLFGYSNSRNYVSSLSISNDTTRKCRSSCVLKRKSVFPFNPSSHKPTQKRMNLWKLPIQKLDHCDRFFPSFQVRSFWQNDESDKFSFTWLQYYGIGMRVLGRN